MSCLVSKLMSCRSSPWNDFRFRNIRSSTVVFVFIFPSSFSDCCRYLFVCQGGAHGHVVSIVNDALWSSDLSWSAICCVFCVLIFVCALFLVACCFSLVLCVYLFCLCVLRVLCPSRQGWNHSMVMFNVLVHPSFWQTHHYAESSPSV